MAVIWDDGHKEVRQVVITPKGTQKDVLALPPKGHTVVLGTAGSGKTTMALLRAEILSNLNEKPSVLIITYNRPLATYMHGIHSSTQCVTVETFHKFALGYLKSQGRHTDNAIISEKEKEAIIASIVDAEHRANPGESTFLRPVQTFIDEIQFLERFGVASLEQYTAMERIGRAHAYISRENRRHFFAVYTQYQEIRRKRGYLYDWDDVAIDVYNALLDDHSERRYSHIIVDEGQDLSPMMLKSLVNAVASGGSFTFFGDVAQQIYGNALSWKASGINTQKVWRFQSNYRNPKEIAEFAQDITKHPQWGVMDENYIKAPKFEIPAAGIKPTLLKCKDTDAEFNSVVKLIKDRPGRNVIIVKNRTLTGQFVSALAAEGIFATELKHNSSNSLADGIYVTTFYSAKGLEFDFVFVPFLNEDDFPDKDSLSAAEYKDKVLENTLKLFYVAATRAKQGLIMTYSGTLTELFPVESKNYIASNREVAGE